MTLQGLWQRQKMEMEPRVRQFGERTGKTSWNESTMLPSSPGETQAGICSSRIQPELGKEIRGQLRASRQELLQPHSPWHPWKEELDHSKKGQNHLLWIQKSEKVKLGVSHTDAANIWQSEVSKRP